MEKSKIPTMAADDPRQYMLNERMEIYMKTGVPSGALEMHFHNFYEIMYITEGTFTILIDNTDYLLHAGDFVLIGINKLHHYRYLNKAHNDSKRILFWISKEYLEKLSGPNYNFEEAFKSDKSPAWTFPSQLKEELEDYLLKLLYLNADLNIDEEEKRLLQNSYTSLFFVHLNKFCKLEDESFSIENTYGHPMIRTVSEYINENIDKNIDLDKLAASVHLSKYHFARTFKKTTGMTVRNFIIQKRLILACELIWAKEPLKNIYSICGFNDYSSFYRNFKAFYGISPSQFKGKD